MTTTSIRTPQDREARLPVWAASLIEQLRRELRRVELERDEAREDAEQVHGGRGTVRLANPHLRVEYGAGPGGSAALQAHQPGRDNLSSWLRGRPVLRVSTLNGGLLVLPQAGNSVLLTTEDR